MASLQTAERERQRERERDRERDRDRQTDRQTDRQRERDFGLSTTKEGTYKIVGTTHTLKLT